LPQLGVRRTRRAENRNFRLKKPVWIDPYPAIPGTEPEKRLFEALIRRHIYFIFQGDLPELQADNKTRLTKRLKALETEIRHLIMQLAKLGNKNAKLESVIREKLKLREKLIIEMSKLNQIEKAGVSGAFLFQPGFKPDFILPEYRVIIDPFGIFHHSLPEAVKRDAMKSVVYRALGYAFYHPWWDERGYLWADGTGTNLTYERLGYDANAVLDRIPQLHQGPLHKLTDQADKDAKLSPGYRLGKNLGAGANSVAIANQKRTRAKNLGIRIRGRRRRTIRR